MKLIVDNEDFDVDRYMDKHFGDDVETDLEKVVEYYLEDYSLEDLLEEFDITPVECIIQLWRSGYITRDDLARFLSTDA